MQIVKIDQLKPKTRLDNFLSSYFPDITRSTSKKIILQKLVKLNGKKARPNMKVNNGDEVEIDLDSIRSFIDSSDATEITPVEMKLDIIFEDPNTIVLNKESGVVVHPSYMHNVDSLMNGLVYYVIHHNKDPFVRIRPVHRLDRDTSGIILFSKNLEAHNFYSKQFKNRDVEKNYLAIVKGDFKAYLDSQKKDSLVVSSYIAKSPAGFVYKSVDSSKGDYAETQISFEKYLGEENEYSLLQVSPHTGRTHQIRVHVSDLGFPIVGDVAYGGIESKRLMLHAWKLKVKLFGEDSFRIFEAQVPEEFSLWVSV